MNKTKFEQLAKKTGANKCLDFDWSYNLKESCMKNYLQEQTLCACVMLKGEKCDCFKEGIS